MGIVTPYPLHIFTIDEDDIKNTLFARIKENPCKAIRIIGVNYKQPSLLSHLNN